MSASVKFLKTSNEAKNKIAFNRSSLEPFLNQLQKKYHLTQYLYSDPLSFVYNYTHPLDQEAVALIAALLAYGKVSQIKNSIQNALDIILSLSESPQFFVNNLTYKPSFYKKALNAFKDWKHRFNTGEDLVHLLVLLGLSWKKHGSLGNHFLTFASPHDAHVGTALNSLILEWKKRGSTYGTSFQYFLTAPEDGSCCKRWNMFLRWMGRKDQLDPGLWTQGSFLISSRFAPLQSSKLILPLDTHTARITHYLGLRQQRTVNWKAALEVTENFKMLDAHDPTRYDFSLSRLGILAICQKFYRKEICQSCDLLPGCQFALKSIDPKSSYKFLS